MTTPVLPEGACPCGSGQPEQSCCGPILAGTPARTAEALMRSRYVAYVRGAIDHVIESHDPDTRQEVDRDATEKWSRETEWPPRPGDPRHRARRRAGRGGAGRVRGPREERRPSVRPARARHVPEGRRQVALRGRQGDPRAGPARGDAGAERALLLRQRREVQALPREVTAAWGLSLVRPLDEARAGRGRGKRWPRLGPGSAFGRGARGTRPRQALAAPRTWFGLWTRRARDEAEASAGRASDLGPTWRRKTRSGPGPRTRPRVGRGCPRAVVQKDN